MAFAVLDLIADEMKATILAHQQAPDSSPTEIHRFTFQLDDGKASPYSESISLRAARVIVENLEDGNAFIKMLQAIVAADPSDYDRLVGKVYPDHFPTGHAGERPMPGPDSEGPLP